MDQLFCFLIIVKCNIYIYNICKLPLYYEFFLSKLFNIQTYSFKIRRSNIFKLKSGKNPGDSVKPFVKTLRYLNKMC